MFANTLVSIISSFAVRVLCTMGLHSLWHLCFFKGSPSRETSVFLLAQEQSCAYFRARVCYFLCEFKILRFPIKTALGCLHGSSHAFGPKRVL
jgi:hypothetical protein